MYRLIQQQKNRTKGNSRSRTPAEDDFITNFIAWWFVKISKAFRIGSEIKDKIFTHRLFLILIQGYVNDFIFEETES